MKYFFNLKSYNLVMTEIISDEIKTEIFQLISTPGLDIQDIPQLINQRFDSNLSYEKVLEILSDEYFKCNLDHGRRLCCR
jgi:hypothetical protein